MAICLLKHSQLCTNGLTDALCEACRWQQGHDSRNAEVAAFTEAKDKAEAALAEILHGYERHKQTCRDSRDSENKAMSLDSNLYAVLDKANLGVSLLAELNELRRQVEDLKRPMTWPNKWWHEKIERLTGVVTELRRQLEESRESERRLKNVLQAAGRFLTSASSSNPRIYTEARDKLMEDIDAAKPKEGE